MNEHKYKIDFIKKHDCDYQIHTSNLSENGTYHKEYIFNDGAILYEVNTIITELKEITFEVNGLQYNKTVEVLQNRTELWTTDDAHSVYFYDAIYDGVKLR